MTKVLMIDAEKCSGCRLCELACAFNKEKRIVPILGRINVFQNYAWGLSVPVVCTQCEEAPCIKVCPTEALYRDPETNAVKVKEEKCIGCKLCVSACPQGGIVFVPEKKVVIKCDLCDGDPVCVKFCPTGAIKYEEPVKATLAKRREKAEKVWETLT